MRMFLCVALFVIRCLLCAGTGHGPGPGPGPVKRQRSPMTPPDFELITTQMQSRAVDTRVTLEVLEEQPRGTSVGFIPTKPGFTYRFNEPPREFSLDPVSGEIRTSAVLDRESLRNDRYDLVVLSSQPTYPIEVRIVVLDVNDHSPEFPEPSIAVSFSESAAPGTRLLLDAATDRDAGRNGVSDDYRIVAGNKDEKFKLIVTANPSGEITYLHLETTGKLDRESLALYKLNVSARDGGEPLRFGFLQVNVTVLDVNDNPPIFDHSDYIVSLNESVPPGTPVLQVMATDSDVGDNAKVTYYLADTEHQFGVDPETGVISTTEILECPQTSCPQLPQPRGCPKSCVFTVFARDHGTPRQDGRTYVTVNLVDANDHDPLIKFRYFPSTSGFATVDENAVNGSVVAAVSVIDLDEGLNGETSVEIRAGNELGHFRLERTPSFDIVRVHGVLDREEVSRYNLTVVARDKGSPSRTATAFLIIHVNDVNDHEPVFEKSEYSAVLSELAPIGTYVAGITAVDEDSGVNAQIYYAFVSGNDRQWFNIDSDSGLITTRASLDREQQDTVELRISARDGGPNPKWAYSQLKVTILDENDERPQFSQEKINVSLSESTPPNTLVAMLTATDQDQGTNGSVTYSLRSDVDSSVFALDTLTGQLTIRTKLDRESISEYKVCVIARDQGLPPQSSTATVFLKVLDVNDNSPEFYPQLYVMSIPEDMPQGSSLLKVSAVDQDEEENAVLTYSLESGDSSIFELDKISGTISLKHSLLNAPKSLYKLKISAKDRGDRKAVEDAEVEFIKDTHLEDLEFESYNGYEFKILEDHGKKSASVGREVGRVQVRPVDYRTRDEPIRYAIVLGDPSRSFQIDKHSGVITTAQSIDREEVPFYTLTVVARAGLALGTTHVNVSVLDLNDNSPVFAQEKDEVSLPENAAVGQEVYLARAKDRDSGENSRIMYSLSYNPEEQFRVYEATGVIYLNKPVHAAPGSVMTIEVTATDGGESSLTSRHTVLVTVHDVNDHTPIFDHTSYETSLLESTPVNSRFFALSASDSDLGLNGLVEYQIIEGDSDGKFGIFPDGFLYVKSTLDREDHDYYSLTVIARDHGNPFRSSIVPVVIHVIDENDNSPEFTNNTFSFYIAENEPPDSFVGKLSAVDRDVGRNAELTFYLFSNLKDFTVDPKNGFIKTLHVFDREELMQSTGQGFITLEAAVTDNGATRLRDKVKVNVHITDENDNAPKFLRLPYRVQVSEASSVGTQIFRVFTTDADEGLNGDVFYSIISGNDNGCFAIDEATGQITVAKVLDRETTEKYSLSIMAQDAGLTVRLNSSAQVIIDILDENDNAPVFTQTESCISVSETTPVNTRLIQFRASDADLSVNSEVSFSISAGNRRDTFHVDSLSGALYLHKSLDYEELTSYTLNVTASDGGNPRLSTTILFHIAVEDSNDNPPSFPNTAIVRQIREGIPINTPIVTITAEDPDSGINGQVTYAILKQEPLGNHFDINVNTGVIHTRLPIDREVVDTFRLTVVATDQAVPHSTRLSAEKLVTVIVEDVNDNAPSFISMSAAILPRTRHSTRSLPTVMTVVAKDLDSSTNGLVTYELVSGDSDIFHLHRSTGTLTLRHPLSNPRARYHLVVKATDEAVQAERKSTDAYITVIATGDSEGPSFDSSSVLQGSVYENEPQGTSILRVSAHMHTDPSAELEYYVTNVSAAGKQVDRLFDVDTKLGVLSTAVVLDRETGNDIYEVEIYAVVVNSPKLHTSSTKVRVAVLDKNDSPPSFGNTPLEYAVSEDLPIGQIVATLRAIDPDTLGELSYSLVSGDEGHFSLDKDSGALKLRESLDRETTNAYKLHVRSSDGQQHSDTVVTIKVTDTNDNPPVFSESAYSFDVPENAGRGARVGEVTATDVDQGVNGQVAYSVISDWANDVFSLNPQSGVFTLTARLDYEEVQHYIFVVQAQDSGRPSLSSTVTVYFNVVDLNDNAPVFDPMSYSNEVLENVTIGTTIVTVTATDLDSGDNGEIVYSISSGDDDGEFEISQNGTIITAKTLDRETKSLYNLVVMASDQANPPQQRLSSTVQVSVVLKDVNDVSPEFITPNETSVLENIPVNTVIMAVKAVDKDEGRNSYIEYTLSLDSTAAGLFSLGPVDGLLRVIGRLDREVRANYTLHVTAKDRGEPARSTRIMIFLKVIDENDNSPVFDPKQYSASVAENASIGASVLQVSATDVDEGSNGRVRYAISSGDENRDFSISEDTGVVRVAKNLNFERKSRYLLTVRAEDCADDTSDEAVRFDTAAVSIVVADINDNPPVFLDSPYLAYVMENVVPGFVLRVRAHDADSPPYNGQVRYFLKEGDANLFRINASTGEISLLRALDRELQAEYTLALVAMDTGTPPLTGTGTVRVVVQDVNDHSPEFERQVYTGTVKENLPAGAVVIHPVAIDKDEGLNAKIRYSLLGENAERFHVDTDSGLITTAVPLDREETAVYYLTLIAQDSSVIETRASAVNLTISVLDDNDNSPRFSNQRYTVHIPDSTNADQFVFGAKATDADSGVNSRVVFSLSGQDADKFTIEKETGVIKALKKLNVDGTDKIFYLQIKASDSGKESRFATAELLVKFWPAHMFPVITAPHETKFTLPEDVAAGRIVTRVAATSPKPPPAGNIRFAIAGGNIGDALRIDSNTGEVVVVGGGLDYETESQYSVWVEARDSDVPALQSVVQLVIDVTDANDNAPEFTEGSLYNASILEEEPPPLKVTRVSAKDRDSDINGQVTYRLVNDDGSFDLDSETGEIFTQVRLDRESSASYHLVVEAVDQGTPQLTGTTTILVTVLDKNDNPPRFTRLFSVNVTENAEPGAFVIKVTSSDLDVGENANASYSFTENPGEKFTIDPLTGNVTVAGPLDRETQDEYLLKVAAVDGSWRAETPLTITIQDQNDNAPEFEHSYYNFNFPELQQHVMFVGQVTATDRDKQGPNSVISYALKQPSDLFSVDPASGELFSKRKLQYRHTSMEPSPENQYSLIVTATDNGKPPMSSECLVTINVVDANNNPPKFVQHEYFTPVPEIATLGQKVVRIVAKDDKDFGVNAEIEYSKVGGNGTELFEVGKTSGWITVSRSLSGSSRLSQYYTLVVRASDRGVPSLYDETRITLVITGENKYTPVFTALSYQVLVPENEPVGSTILVVSAIDADKGPNGMVQYAIASGNDRKEFDINPISGSVTIRQPLDYDTIQEYHLNISASDLGFEPRIAMAMLTVTLTDINDNAPVFNQTSYNAYLPENYPPKSFVYRVKAHDIDSPRNAIIQYSIVGGTGKDMFRIEPKTGEIYSKNSFDYEERNLYTLDILASNPDSPMYGSTRVMVHITGQNEYFPRFIQSVFYFDVSESAEVGTSVGMIQATDQDAGSDGVVYYLFVGSSNDRGFSIGSETGLIKVSRRLDRETQNRVVLSVMAKNAGSIRGNDTDEAQVIVSVQDGNDPPEFLQQVYETQVSEGASPGTKILTVKAVDKDVRPQNNQFLYSIIGGNAGHAFKVDPQTGDVETTLQLDRETVSMYVLTVGAIDTGTPPQTGTTVVKVTVLDVNDNGPVFDPAEVKGYVAENEPPNTSVMTLSASDPDLPPNGAPFTYYLVGGKHKDMVTIEQHTGILKTTRTVDRESTPLLDILVEVEDSGEPKMRSRHPVTIVVLDQNDSPSTPRAVHVHVNTFQNLFPVGKIADVHPNDLDTTGDYQCKLLSSVPSKGIFSIPVGCNLHVFKVIPGSTHSLSVTGNDGRHSDVVSTVTVDFATFDNTTVENSITIRLENITSVRFLTQFYKGMLNLLKSAFGPNDQPLLYGMQDISEGLELTVAVRSGKDYHIKQQVIDILNKKRNVIQQFLQSTPITIDYSPCRNPATCDNHGYCTDGIYVHEETSITDSQNLVFTSPLVSHDFTCRCTEGFTGRRCDRKQDPCSPNPCKAGGTCRRQGHDFQCVCPPVREGKFCELEKGDVCDGNPCLNGGSCRESPDGSSFFCLCRPGYRGNQCETVADSCRPNPCMYGGLCISLKPGYRCSCPEARYGRHCERSTFGFTDLSYMAFPPLDAGTNDISIVFATTKPNALLVYNYGLQTGGRSDFLAVELVEGRAVFSYGGARTAITSVTVTGGDYLSNGKWHKVTATRNGRVVSLSVSPCSEHGDMCQECRPGDETCYADVVGPSGTLNFNSQEMLIGGLVTADPVLERPGQIHSDDLVGCVHGVSVNGRALNLSSPLHSRGIEPTCARQSLCGTSNHEESGNCGTCLDKWHTSLCRCDTHLVAPNCGEALRPVTIMDGGFVEFKVTEKHRRMQLLEGLYRGSTLWQSNANYKRILAKRWADTNNLAKSLGITFRTVRPDGLLLYSATNKDFTSIELRDGHLVYVSRLGAARTPVNMTVASVVVSDGQWHNLTVVSHNRGVRLMLDGHRIGDELDMAGVHDFLDPYLTVLSLGGVRREFLTHPDSMPAGFEGCLANFTVNNEIQPFNGSGTIFNEVLQYGKVSQGCTGPVGVGAATAPNPLSIGITLVIVFFVILLVGILVSFLVFRLRRQKKEKGGAPGPGPHSKQNGGATIVSGSGPNEPVLGRGLDSGFMGDSSDVLRGHHLVGPELLTKKFKEREIIAAEPRPQRPDIIEREVVSKSLPLRDEHHVPPLPPPTQAVPPPEVDIPEHYDLENASSIAPSDIDVVFHYKGFREGGNVRKYKAAPPHLPPPGSSYHHKHQQHRHAGGFPRDVPPPPASRVDSPPSTVTNSGPTGKLLQHQTTPLARLSPSSEMSSQQAPRILTLQDISGKPLQSALLATTTTSSGGKDPLHSTSERSLNSPVMSQLSGQSSSAGRKTPGDGNVVSSPAPPTIGLTAEEIERLNSRPRTSSLVSTLDAVSSSSEAPRTTGVTVSISPHHLHHPGAANGSGALPDDNHSSTSSDESGNDSFTCSEFEYDHSDKRTDHKSGDDDDEDRRIDGPNKTPLSIVPMTYDGFDSSFRGSLSTLVASDDDIPHPTSNIYRPHNGSPSSLGWDYFLNWGPNFENLVGVFKDIAELPDSVNSRVPSTLRLPSGAPKPSEEYV